MKEETKSRLDELVTLLPSYDKPGLTPWSPGPVFCAIRDAAVQEPEAFLGTIAFLVGLLCPRKEEFCLDIAQACFAAKGKRNEQEAKAKERKP
jgi:hypothetical protein